MDHADLTFVRSGMGRSSEYALLRVMQMLEMGRRISGYDNVPQPPLEVTRCETTDVEGAALVPVPGLPPQAGRSRLKCSPCPTPILEPRLAHLVGLALGL